MMGYPFGFHNQCDVTQPASSSFMEVLEHFMEDLLVMRESWPFGGRRHCHGQEPRKAMYLLAADSRRLHKSGLLKMVGSSFGNMLMRVRFGSWCSLTYVVGKGFFEAISSQCFGNSPLPRMMCNAGTILLGSSCRTRMISWMAS